MENQQLYIYKAATTKGRWGNEELHEVLNDLQAACKGA
jgi:hypothetical protein